MYLSGAYIMIYKPLVCNELYDRKVLWLLRVHWNIIVEMGKVLPSRTYLLLALKWVGPKFSVILYFLIHTFFWSLSKRKINKFIKQYNEPVVQKKHN